ncbi:MAG: redoxin domain-containing protein [Alphaproteobacteria bacterium]|nr:redoxin domain-containing protein [Alphaproteobacteria bacterium]
MTSIYDFTAKTIDGDDQSLSAYADKVMLIVNVASKCGFTPQYKGLEALYRKHRDEGFVVLGFPCNQFAGQEPGDEDEIITFCTTHYDVTFPMFAKIDVNGPDTHPLYRYLKTEKPGLAGSTSIKWNFTKFLVDRKGSVIERFAPQARPDALEADIRALL